jgi:hypothetical protein
MFQHDFEIDDQTSSDVRKDINNALVALAANSSGDSAPPRPKPSMFWYRTDTNLLKIRNEANSAWINVGYVDQTNKLFNLLEDSKIVTPAGVDRATLGRQPENTWENGTSETESFVSPKKLKAAILANTTAGADPVGVSQEWATVTRSINTVYRNTKGKAVQISVSFSHQYAGYSYLSVSHNNTDWTIVGRTDTSTTASVIIPDDHYYRIGTDGGGTPTINSFAILS